MHICRRVLTVDASHSCDDCCHVQPKVADEIIHIWRNLSPPGRFLTRIDTDEVEDDDDYTAGRWQDVGDSRAKTKTCQCLRGKSMPFSNYSAYQPTKVMVLLVLFLLALFFFPLVLFWCCRERKDQQSAKKGRLTET